MYFPLNSKLPENRSAVCFGSESQPLGARSDTDVVLDQLRTGGQSGTEPCVQSSVFPRTLAQKFFIFYLVTDPLENLINLGLYLLRKKVRNILHTIPWGLLTP